MVSSKRDNGSKGGSKGGKSKDGKGSAKGIDRGSDRDKDIKDNGRWDTGKDAGKKGKGGSKGKGSPVRDGAALSGAKTVQELEANMLIATLSGKGNLDKDVEKRQRESGKQPLEANGSHCVVKKHSDMGCAVVTMHTEAAREVVVKLGEQKPAQTEKGAKEGRPEIKIGDVVVQFRPHVDKNAKTEVKTDIFVAWGRQAEKLSPLSAAAIAEAFDKLFLEAQPAGALLQVAPSAAAQSRGGPQLLPPPMGVSHPPQPPQAMMPNQLFDLMAAQVAQAQAAQAAQAQAQAQAVQHQQQFGVPQQPNAVQVAQAAAMVAQVQQAAQAQAYVQAAQAQAQAQAAQAQAVQAAQAAQAAHQQNGLRPGMETPPPRNSSGANEMRADAPSFTFSPQQDGGYFNSLEQQYDVSNYLPGGLEVPERKAFAIVNPKSGATIEVEPPKNIPGFEAPKKPGHKPLVIVDPKSGATVDTIGMNFTPPKAAKPFSIIDPTSGSTIKV